MFKNSEFSAKKILTTITTCLQWLKGEARLQPFRRLPQLVLKVASSLFVICHYYGIIPYSAEGLQAPFMLILPLSPCLLQLKNFKRKRTIRYIGMYGISGLYMSGFRLGYKIQYPAYQISEARNSFSGLKFGQNIKFSIQTSQSIGYTLYTYDMVNQNTLRSHKSSQIIRSFERLCMLQDQSSLYTAGTVVFVYCGNSRLCILREQSSKLCILRDQLSLYTAGIVF